MELSKDPKVLPSILAKEEGKPAGQSTNKENGEIHNKFLHDCDKAHDQSDGYIDLALRVASIMHVDTICSIMTFTLFFLIPIANVIIGTIYLNDCKINQYIPIHLIVAGVAGISKGLNNLILFLITRWTKDELLEKARKYDANPIDQILDFFMLAWLICGSVWVFSKYGDVQHKYKHDDDYCHEVCYKYAFWFLIVNYIILALTILYSCVGCIVFCRLAFNGVEEESGQKYINTGIVENDQT